MTARTLRIAICLTGFALVIAVSGVAASASEPSHLVTTLTLSPQDLYSSLNASEGHLFLVGPDSLIEPGSALSFFQDRVH